MNLSLNWLNDFVKLPKNITPDELAKKLTLHTVEVEGVIRQADKYSQVVIGKILEVKKHPDADRLQIASVDTGADKREIVCGAPNIAKGQLVPVALPGAVLPNGAEIKEAEVRGVKSAGMLCAEDELGLGSDHSGILILKKAKIGQKFSDYLKLDDVILEVDNKSITNRPDLWSHMGMARDIAAIFDLKFHPYIPKEGILTPEVADGEKLKIKVDDAKLCPRYIAVVLSGIKVEPSPKWMQDRLMAAGMRPINNIVDITNYVMLEIGQPLHAFDRRLADEIVVRRARANEEITTLDGVKRKLTADDLVIANSKIPVGIAGVMGGENSEISADTTSIMIESANFDASSVRKTSTRQGIRSEASMRFEKSLDPNLCELAIARTVELIKQSCPETKQASALIDLKDFKLNLGPIVLPIGDIERLIGMKIEEGRSKKILRALGFEVAKEAGNLLVTVPSWRATKDVSIKEDLIEEIARIYGYNNLTSAMPRFEMREPYFDPELALEGKIKSWLSTSAAMSEMYNYSFVGEDQLRKLGVNFNNHIRLVNPMSANHTLLRQSLAPNLLNNIRTNQSRYGRIGLFEIGSVYLPSPGHIIKRDQSDETLPYEEKRLGLALAGDNLPELYNRLKGVIEWLGGKLNIESSFSPREENYGWAQAGYSASFITAGKTIGYIAAVDSGISRSIGLKKQAVIAEISLPELIDAINRSPDKRFREFDKFPYLTRDLAFVVDAGILYNDIRKEILSFNPLIKEVELFDLYEGEKLGKGKKSLAFHVIYQADRTLVSEEVDKVQAELVKRMEEKFEAKLRDF